jgi:uncharacterized protein YjbI with pentapeptide repeats
MADLEQLDILQQGVGAWNKWREGQSDGFIDLAGAELRGAALSFSDLSKARLWGAHLSEAQLRGANLSNADLWGADLRRADLRRAILLGARLRAAVLSGANLSRAELRGASLSGADLSGANLSGVDLSGVDLSGADLSGADLGQADLSEVNLRDSNLEETSLLHAYFADTILGPIDLRKIPGLETIQHRAPSPMEIETIVRSEGQIPEAFLRGCGLSDWQIESSKLYNPNLSDDEITTALQAIHTARAGKPFQIIPLFISYSSQDAKFVDQLGDMLDERGIRYWRDRYDMAANQKENRIGSITRVERVMRRNPRVLLVLSGNSVRSDWLEVAVTTAVDLKKDRGWDVLSPVALDDSWKTGRGPQSVMEQLKPYNVQDFSSWEDDQLFKQMSAKLIDQLGLFYK